MEISNDGLDLLKRFEGLSLKAYAATADEKARGIWTIGYGSTYWPDGRPVKATDKLRDEKEAVELLRATVQKYADTVDSVVKVHLTQNQFDALVSLCYNIGQSAFENSTLVRKLNATDIKPVADQILVWNKQSGKVLKGLVNRRKVEHELFLK